MKPYVRTTAYEVSIFPDWMREHDDYEIRHDANAWSVKVEWRGKGKWAVIFSIECLSADGEWDYEPSPSHREDDWLKAHRFDLETALRLAKEAAPHVRIMGRSALEIYDINAQRASSVLDVKKES